MKNINFRHFCINTFLTIFINIICIIIQNANNHNAANTIGILGILQYLYACYSWAKVQGTYINPYILFITAFYVFTFGQSFILPFGLIYESRDLINFLSIDEIINAQILTLLFLGFFHSGSLLGIKKHALGICVNQTEISNIKRIGLILFTISFVPFMIESIDSIKTVYLYGYRAIYLNHQFGLENSTSFLSKYYMLPSLFLLLYSYKNNKKFIYFFYIFFTFFIISELYKGGRTDAVVLIAVYILYYHYVIKPIKRKQLLTILLSGYLFLSLLAVVANLRNEPNRSLDIYINTFANSFGKENLLFNTISEMGWSMFPMGKTMSIVPSTYPFRYGSTIIYSFSSIIPNLGFWEIHPAAINANLGPWLQDILNISYGPGYSLVAEAYLNFGYFGFILLFFYGFFLARIFCNVSKEMLIHKPLIFILAIIFAYLTIKTVRNSFLNTVRCYFYVYLLIHFYNKHIYKLFK